ncbi:MAG: STM4015 family protein [Cellulosilyticaceae bacterium]
MEKHFIYQDEKSQKFWSIKTEGLTLEVCYGRLGTAGQKKEKIFEDEQALEKEVNKLIKEKTKKGYVESDKEEVIATKDEAKRYGLTSDDVWDDGKGIDDLIKRMAKDKKLQELKHITIGCWGESCDENCQKILDFLVENKDKLGNLETLFVADMDYEECEVSWIEQGNYTDVIKTFPNLKKLKIKGSNGLVLSPMNHENLEHIEIICGGLPTSVLKELVNSKLPNLKTLILYLGVDNYGFDGSIEDVKPLLSKALFPSLTRLELVDSEIEDEVVKAVLESDILAQLKQLAFSKGCLTDEGGNEILQHQDKVSHLENLDLSYHYLTDEMMEKLKALPIQVDVSDQQEAECYSDGDVYRYPMLTE